MSVRLATSNSLSGFRRILVFGLLLCCLHLLALSSQSGAAAPSAGAGQRSDDVEGEEKPIGVTPVHPIECGNRRAAAKDESDEKPEGH